MAKPAARKKGASRNTRTASGRKGVPAGLWLVLGLAVGAFTAFLWHLWDLRAADKASAKAEVAAPASETSGEPDKKTKEPEGEPRFEFYTLLPSQEVIPGKSGTNPPSPAPATSEKEIQYMLQAGSFRSEAEADKRRASILMLGMPVKIAKVTGKPGETWYRVVVGPFAGKTAAQSARDNLRNNGVDSLLVKQG
jgi:cell division protein FtsN